MQLVAYGAQDIYLTGNPQITFFKVVYRRHTNFSMETIQQTINGTATIGINNSGNVTISRNGDLVHRVYVSVSAGTIKNGSAIVKEAELEIGGQKIDKHYREWNEVWNELSTPESKALGLKSMQSCVGTSTIAKNNGIVNQVQVPLNFWFCRNPGLALPLIALQYHEVKIKFMWGSVDEAGSGDCVVMADYIYLDTDERRRFAQVSHEYLIEQIQLQTGAAKANQVNEKLNFNHPVKELIWTLDGADRMDEVVLKLNGHDRFSAQGDEYFTLRQPFDYHTAVPRQNLPAAAQSTLQDRGVLIDSLATGGGTSLGTKPYAGAAGTLDSAEEAVYDATANTLTLQSTATTLTTALAPGDQLIINIASGSGTLPTDLTVLGDYLGTVATAVAAGTNFVSPQDIVFKSDPVSLQDNSTALVALPAAQAANTFSLNMVGKLNVGTNEARTSKMTKRIGVYSFALKPEEHQPSGTCNFSRIDNAQLTGKTVASETTVINIYAVNYNVLRIMSGMGGLAYSN